MVFSNLSRSLALWWMILFRLQVSSLAVNSTKTSKKLTQRRNFFQLMYRQEQHKRRRQRNLISDREALRWNDDYEDIFQRKGEKRSSQDQYIYVHAQNGNDNQDGSTSSKSVQTLTRALKLVSQVSRPLTSNLIVELSGTFELQQLKITDAHTGTSKNKRLIFRGAEGAKILGGRQLKFVRVNSLGNNHPVKLLADRATGVSNNLLWAAEPPANFPLTNVNSARFTDGDCRDTDEYLVPPTLSVNGNMVLTRAREPNPPLKGASDTNESSLGGVQDSWMRTSAADSAGRIRFKTEDQSSISKASSESWNSGSVTAHIFPLVDWFDARVPVGKTRNSNLFTTSSSQTGPGNPEGGDKFKITKEARYYLEGAIEYLDSEGEYFVSLGEVEPASSGWTLFYPQSDLADDFTAVLSLEGKPLVRIEEGSDMFISFENLHLEGSRRKLVDIYGNDIRFRNVKFLNAGHDAAAVYGQRVTFSNCIFEGSGGSSLRLEDDRDIDTDGPGYLLLESGNAVVDSLLSDFASSCRHYSEGVALGGYGTIIANNHFRSSNMAAIDVVGGGFKILHNVFSHVSDGSYDDGAIHWVASSPMERGTEVAYNLFFRNGVSTEPCNAETSCYQADIYMDDSAGAMSIHGNVMIKDKLLQTSPPSNAFSKIQWLGILINGGADVTVYENSFLGPKDGISNGAIYRNKAALYEQTSGGTLWSDGKSCGHTGICKNNEFYKLMRQLQYTKDPWASTFPELSKYNANPKGSQWYCANRRSCPLASWNQTVVCNAAIGDSRMLSHRAIWASDTESQEYESAEPGINVPIRDLALIEYGNKPAISAFEEDVQSIDNIERQGMAAVLELGNRVAMAGESTPSRCDQGTRTNAARMKLAGRGSNPCTYTWILNGLESCDPCSGGSVGCAPRDLSGDNCACNGAPTPTPPVPEPTPSPTPLPTKAPTLLPTSTPKSPPTKAPTPLLTLAPSPNPDPGSWECVDDSTFRFENKANKDCKWVGQKRNKRCKKNWEGKSVGSYCPQTCRQCPFRTERGNGYCNSTTERTVRNARTPKKCWAKCQKLYQWNFAELTDGVCYCQKECSCRNSVGNKSILAILPSKFPLSEECNIK